MAQLSHGRPVVVTTEYRGVFFGYVKSHDEATRAVVLTNARNCLSWTEEVKGFLGLAVTGPCQGCRVGPAAPTLRLDGVTSIADCTPEATKAWETPRW